MNRFEGLSEAALKANMQYARVTGNHMLYSLNHDVLYLPFVDKQIKKYNSAIAATNNKQIKKESK